MVASFQNKYSDYLIINRRKTINKNKIKIKKKNWTGISIACEQQKKILIRSIFAHSFDLYQSDIVPMCELNSKKIKCKI